MKKIFDWFKNNKILLAIIGTISMIASIVFSAVLIFFGFKDSKQENETNQTIKDTETEVKETNAEKTDIETNVNNSSNTVDDIKDKVF